MRQFDPKDTGYIIVDANGMIELEGSKEFIDTDIPEDSELKEIYADVKSARKHILNYLHDKKLSRHLSIEDAQERWGQVVALETVLRAIRDYITHKEMEKHGHNKTKRR